MDHYTEIDSHIEEFEGLRVVNYDPENGLSDPATTAPRLQAWYKDIDPEERRLSTTRKAAMVAVAILTAVGAIVWSIWALLFGLFATFTLLPSVPTRRLIANVDEVWLAFENEAALDDVQALVIGPWFMELDQEMDGLIERLARLADKLPNLRAIFVHDVVSYECEISWLPGGDMTPLLDAYPNLETLVVRGADDMRFEGLRHDKLRKLVVQSGGMGHTTIAELAHVAELPSLEHLELWLGDPNYGFRSTVGDLFPLWQPDRFPALQTLALRNSMIADEIACELAKQPEAVSRLDRLDLSLGTLSDLGAAALYNNPGVEQLDELDLHHHYISPDWVAKLKALPPAVNLDCAQEPPHPDFEDDRYVAVSE